jgi:hypothetical protein
MVKRSIISLLLIITVLVPLWFDGHLYSTFDLSKITVLYILAFTLLGVWVYIGKVSVFKRDPYNILTYPILGIFASCIISTVFAVSPYVSFAGTYKRYGGLVTNAVYMILFFAVIEFVDMKRVRYFIHAILITAGVSCVYAVVQYAGLDPYNWSIDFGYRGRPSAAFGHPTFFSAYLSMALCLCIYLIMKGNKWMYGLAILFIYCMVISVTRSAFVGMAVSLIYFFLLYKKRVSYKLVGAVLIVIICLNIFIPDSPVKRLHRELKGWNPTGNIGYRLRIGAVCSDIIKDNPVVGIGLDCLGSKYQQYYERRYNEVCISGNNRAHNAVMSILVEQGVIGMMMWLWLLFYYFWIVFQKRDNLLVVALSSGVVAYSVQNMATFGGVSITPLFWMLMALTIVVIKNEDKHNTFTGDGRSSSFDYPIKFPVSR